MANPISQEKRELIVYHKGNGETNENISKWLQISQRSIRRIWKQYKETGNVDPKPRTQGRKPAFDEEVLNKVIEKIKEVPDITLEDMIEEFNLGVTPSSMCRKLIARGITYKKNAEGKRAIT